MSEQAMKYRVRVERNVEATMRDGVVLRADVARPRARGRFPALVQRTPYGKAANTRLAEAGYVVISQDMRGRYASDGEFTPMFMPGYQDAADGYDTVEWAARLPYSDGKVGVYGISYPSWASWELASVRPPHLVAMFNGGYATRLTDWELGGVLRTGRVQQWLFRSLGPDLRRRAGLPGPHTPAEAGESAGKDREKPLWFVPLKDLPDEYAAGCRDIWHYWLDHHHKDIFDFGKRHGEVDVPVLHMTGWHDRLVLTVDHFAGMRRNGRTGRSKGAAAGCRPLVARIAGSPAGRRNGLREIGGGRFQRADGTLVRLLAQGKAERHDAYGARPVFRDGREPVADGAGMAGTGCEVRVVPPGFRRRRKRRVGKREAGQKTATGPRQRPVRVRPARSGDVALLRELPGCAVRSAASGRPADVLVYLTRRLKTGIRAVGRPEVVLHAASSARDTDFIVKLMDVHPDGFVHQVSYGIVRARFRNGFDSPEPLSPGKVCRYRISMLPTAVLFRPGHRIRLDVTSSDFPNFDRNHNTGGDDYADAGFVIARQEIFHGPGRLSRVILPVSD